MNGSCERMSPDVTLSIVIPTFGRGASLLQTIEALHDFLNGQWKGMEGRFEIILVDDASPDDTAAVIRALCAKHMEIKGVLLAGNCGQQNATLAGIRMARGTVVVTMDDDRKNDVRDIPCLLDALAAGYDVAYGVPVEESRVRLHRRLGTCVKEAVLRHVCGKPPGIRLTSFRAMNRATADRVAKETRRKVYVSATVLQEPVRIGQVPVREAVDAVSASGYRMSALLAQLWHIAVQYGRGPIARWFRDHGEPCPVRETVGCD